MAVNARWRTQPFTGDVNSILIEDEEHTIEFIAEINSYGFYANEGVVLDAGDPVSLVEDTTAQTAFIEQPRTIAPNAGQFRVDYDDTDYYNTGFVQCNAADNGQAVLFTYRGTGTIVHPTFRTNTDFNVPGNLYIEGNVSVNVASLLVPYTSGALVVSFSDKTRPVLYISTPISPANITITDIDDASSVILKFTAAAGGIYDLDSTAMPIHWPNGISPEFISGYTYIINLINVNGVVSASLVGWP